MLEPTGEGESGAPIKKNFLGGLELEEFAPLNPAARVWLETVVNVWQHRETNRRPQDLFIEEKPLLRPCLCSASPLSKRRPMLS
jgi:hypothetical protein